MRGQVFIQIMCILGAILIGLLLFLLGGVPIIPYHIIGGLMNKDLAKSTVWAIVLAPIYIGRKFAIYIQKVVIDSNLQNLTTDELVDINRSIVETLNENTNEPNEVMNIMLYGCATYGELKEFNKIIVSEYNKRKK